TLGVTPSLTPQGTAAGSAVLAHGHMARRGDAIGHGNAVAKHAVVGDMHVGHEQVVITDHSDALVQHGATVHAAKFADHVAIADFEACRLTLVGPVLGLGAEGNELKHFVVPTKRGMAGDDYMRPYTGAGTNPDIGANNGKRADFNINVQLRLWMH